MSRQLVPRGGRIKPTKLDVAGLAKALNSAYIGDKNDLKEKKKQTFAPSTIGWGFGNCPRYWYLAFDGTDFQENTDSMGFANMANGTAAHERLERIFEEAGLLDEKEVEAKLEDPPIRGFIDGLSSWEDSVIEFKTTRQESFQVKQATGEASPNHLIQILIYMYITGRKAGFIIYENKNTQELLIIPVEMNEQNSAKLEEVFVWLREVRASWEDQELPIRPYRKTAGKIHSVCQVCPVSKTCWEDKEEGTRSIKRLELDKK